MKSSPTASPYPLLFFLHGPKPPLHPLYGGNLSSIPYMWDPLCFLPSSLVLFSVQFAVPPPRQRLDPSSLLLCPWRITASAPTHQRMICDKSPSGGGLGRSTAAQANTVIHLKLPRINPQSPGHTVGQFHLHPPCPCSCRSPWIIVSPPPPSAACDELEDEAPPLLLRRARRLRHGASRGSCGGTTQQWRPPRSP
jgi:hypothetical protein